MPPCGHEGIGEMCFAFGIKLWIFLVTLVEKGQTFSVLLCDRIFQQLVQLLEACCARSSIQHSSTSIVGMPNSETGLRVAGVDVVECIQLWF